MMKTLFSMAVLAICATVAQATDPVKSTVKVVCYRGEVTDNGSGTVVYNKGGKSLVLTNRHVCPDGNCEIDVYSKGEIYEARWLGVADRGDLAMLEIDTDLPAAPIARNAPKQGETLRRWGYPNGRRQKAKQGKYLGDVGFAGAARVFGVAGESVHGESGSAEFNENGEVVAVLWGGNTTGMCVGLEDIGRFVQRFTR
jgi:S1-C subfamily serine protease